jgi:hypothetical protein
VTLVLAAAWIACDDPAGEATPDLPLVPSVRLTSNATLASAPGLQCYKIETAAATYYLEKSGAGLAALTDRDGHDWIGFRPEPGSGPAGEYRGFPNAVHRQAGSYFHPKNEATDPSTTEVELVRPDRVTISATARNGAWASRYDFFDSHCTFTMTKMPSAYKYWVLYEGTPGGRFDEADWWMTSASAGPQPMTTTHEGDIPAPEWIVFGDAHLKRVLFLAHHEDDRHPDGFYQMQEEMTVFGFGRRKGEKLLDAVPQRFSIGFLETADPSAIRSALQDRFRNLEMVP